MPSNKKSRKGHREPPELHQFQTGQPSPNPGGRPPSRQREKMLRKTDDFLSAVVHAGSRPLTAGDGREIELWKAALDRLYEIAFTPPVRRDGLPSPYPPRIIFGALKLVNELNRDAREQLFREKWETVEAALRYKEHWDPIFEQARLSGRPEPTQLPHPDDVMVSVDGVEMIGPLTSEEKDAMNVAIEMRNSIAGYILDAKKVLTADDLECVLDQLVSEWTKYNNHLPPRLREVAPPGP